MPLMLESCGHINTPMQGLKVFCVASLMSVMLNVFAALIPTTTTTSTELTTTTPTATTTSTELTTTTPTATVTDDEYNILFATTTATTTATTSATTSSTSTPTTTTSAKPITDPDYYEWFPVLISGSFASGGLVIVAVLDAINTLTYFILQYHEISAAIKFFKNFQQLIQQTPC